MKKLLSILMSLMLLILSVADGFSALSLAFVDSSNLDTFASNLAEMIRTYDEDNIDDENNDFDYIDELTEEFPIVYAEKMYNFYQLNKKEENATNNDSINNKTATDFGLPSNAFDLNRLIVKSKNKIDYCDAVDCVNGYRDLYILQYDSHEATISAYEYYISLDSIEYVEPDLIHQVQNDADEENISPDSRKIEAEDVYEFIDRVDSWNSKDIGFDSIVDELAQSELNEVVVAVLDSGIDTDHEMFEGRLINTFFNCSLTGEADSCEDDFGHGTHVAGIIVDNTLSNVKIKPYKVLNNEGKGSLSSIAIAVDLAVAEGADVINMSLTAEGESQTMTESINNAVDDGVNVVVAAGNKGSDLTRKTYTPACIESAITVSAVNKSHQLSSYSNYNGPIDMAAPGDNILSAYLDNTYKTMSGTSMAAPQVSATLAIIRSVFSDKTCAEAEEYLKEYAIEIEENDSNKFGAGILFVRYLLEDSPRTSDPFFNAESGEFVNSFNLTIKCLDKGSRVYYAIAEKNFGDSFDEFLEFNFLDGKLYEKPITISVDTKVIAVAMTDNKGVSSVVSVEFRRRNNSEEDLYDINNSGIITGYVGKETDLLIPQKIRGMFVKGIGSHAFKNNENLHSVVLPSTATSIGTSAFENCTNLQFVTGGSVSNISENAFANSSVSEFNFDKARIISNKAFYNCTNLQNVELPIVEKIGISSFENVQNITTLNSENLKSIGKNAFKNTGIISINLPVLNSLESGAFEKCSSLENVSMPIITEIPANTFKDCIALNEIDMPTVIAIGANSFVNTSLKSVFFDKVTEVGSYAFKDAKLLEYVVLPKTENMGTGCFQGCTNLKYTYLVSLKELKSNIFSYCSTLKSLWLPKVETVKKNAFNNSTVEYVQFDKAISIESLPSTLKGLIISSTLTSITANTPATDFKVYGYENTFAWQYAIENSKEFVLVPAIICETPESVSLEEKYIFTYALGFNCSYQWYKNDTVSNENGTLIENATKFWYEPTRADNAVCYYCVITSTDGINSCQVVTTTITNIPEYRDADFTEYNLVIEGINSIDRKLYTDDSLAVLDEIVSVDISGLSLAEQNKVDEHISAIKKALELLEYAFTTGDINNDGNISLVDARMVLQAVAETISLDEIQRLAADMNGDGAITLVDARMALQAVTNSTQ